MSAELSKMKSVAIEDPNPSRRKRLVEKIYAYLDDRASMAELKGFKREDLFALAEAGHVRLQHGRLDEAEKIFQALLILDHRNPYVHGAMGAVHQKKGRVVEAIYEYTQAIYLNKEDILSHVNRGEIYLRNKNYKKAAEDFRAAILLDMSGHNLWSNRARSLVIAIKRSLEFDRIHPPKKGITVRN